MEYKNFKNSKDELKEVKVTSKPKPPKNNFIDNIRAKIYNKIQEEKLKMWQTVKKFLVQKLVQWILKIGGGFLLSIGISQNSVEEIIGALISILLGVLYSLITHKKIALADPSLFDEN